MFTLKTSNFRTAHKFNVNFDPRAKNGPHTKIKSIYTPTQNQIHRDPNTEVKSISVPTLNQIILACPPTPKPS